MNFKPSARKTPNRGEELEQAKVVAWSHKPSVRLLLPQLRWLHHSPNGGQRDGFTGAQMKALGVKPGFPDLILPVASTSPSGNHPPGLVIEMKSAIGRTSDKQKDWLEHFEAQNWQIRVARSAQEARSILCQYLGIPPDRTPALED
jgi:hypothetical protein